jgi:branched-chain amino acid transport system permease protein
MNELATNILHIVINGLMVGGIYALIALGLNIQYGVGRVFNIAHGEFIMVGAMLTSVVLVSQARIDPLASLAITGPFLFLLGLILYRTLFTSLRRRAASPAAFEANSLLAAFALIYIFENAAVLIFGGWGARTYPYLSFPLHFAGIVLPTNEVVAFAVAVVICVVFYLFVTRSRLGKAIRAAAQDAAVAELMGINVKRVLALCFGLGAMLAGFAGTLISTYASHSESMGLPYSIAAIVVMVVGGLGNIPGSFAGGVIIGLISGIVSHYQSALVVPAYYAIFLIILLVRPQGLLAK